ncbi:hypothetical protein [Homoserinibacter sp. GY 40078]|uniref:hypothetical protein n=1 Tax=Homoserinibacter sp. GY 40078 TaxID=2603275 RepID=UPI0011C72E98|nr:hypothetical protein [Homoserinibacter sp. GY 40078]TXK17089.1 hypothetical protein FVQ89_09435 [Homoserinibacter sp. GY 40078]
MAESSDENTTPADPTDATPAEAPAAAATPATPEDASATPAAPAPRKSRTPLIIALVAVGVIVLGGIGVATWAGVSALTNVVAQAEPTPVETVSEEPAETPEAEATPSKQDIIASGVEIAKAQVELPAQIDENTTLTEILAEEDAVHFVFVISGIDPSLIDEETLTASMVPSVCADTDSQTLFASDIGVQYTIKFEGSDTVYERVFTGADC